MVVSTLFILLQSVCLTAAWVYRLSPEHPYYFLTMTLLLFCAGNWLYTIIKNAIEDAKK